MMNAKLILLSLLTAGLFNACSRDDGDTPSNQDQTASLLITVLDADGSKAMDANVTLYGSQDDYNNKANPISTATTDNLGEVYFEELELKAYWFFAEKQGRNNASSAHSTGVALKAGEELEKMTQLR